MELLIDLESSRAEVECSLARCKPGIMARVKKRVVLYFQTLVADEL